MLWWKANKILAINTCSPKKRETYFKRLRFRTFIIIPFNAVLVPYKVRLYDIQQQL